LLKLLVKKLLRKQGGTYSKLEILILISRAFAGILDKVGRWEVILVFCSALPGFLYQKVRKESYFLDTIEE
jgi:hypothetical protein